MALFKVFKGLRANLPPLSASKDGYCYYTSDDSMFYIDYEIDGVLYRKALNAVDALTLNGASIGYTLENTAHEIPTSEAVYLEFERLYDLLKDFGLSDDMIAGMSGKMDKHNPTGSGYVSINRLQNSDVGHLSVAIGEDNVAKGDNSVALGTENEATGVESIAIGSGAEASGNNSLAMGWFPIASGENSVAIGEEVEATGFAAHAEGQASLAKGDYSHAEGHERGGVAYVIESLYEPMLDSENIYVNRTMALGTGSHAEGLLTCAFGDQSHSQGRYTWALGFTSHAEGDQTKAIGIATHAEGTLTQALGNYSHAQGYSTLAQGKHSFAAGLFTVAQGNEQTVIGRYNILDETSAFIIGNGDENVLSNAFSVGFDGKTYIKNRLFIANGVDLDGPIDPKEFTLYVNGSAYFEGPIEAGVHYIPDQNNSLVTKQYVDDILPRIKHDHLIANAGEDRFIFGIAPELISYYLVYYNGLLLVPDVHFIFDGGDIVLLDWQAEQGDIIHLVGLLPNNYEAPGTIPPAPEDPPIII